MKNLTKVLAMVLVVTAALSGLICDVYAGQASATAMIVIIIPDQKAQGETRLAQETTSADESNSSTTAGLEQLAYKK
jgi:hypothetical protein